MGITQYAFNDAPVDPEAQNVIDGYKGLNSAEIRADLVTKRNSMVSIFMNVTNDFNKATGIRANNVFLGNSVYMVGKRKIDRRGTVGTHHYETVFHADTIEEVIELLRNDGYTIFAVDNIEKFNPKNLWDVDYPEKSAFLYGEEKLGLSDESIALCDDMVFIASEGSVRSLNVACAASVVMAEYSRQHR